MSKENVREIQEYLRALSFYNPRLLPLAADGIYGDETKRAVVFFQKEYDLPQTGEVDSQTWTRLKEAYQLLRDTAVLPLKLFADEQYVLSLGDKTDVVPFLQLVLVQLSQRFTNIEAVPMSGVYDEPTADTVREIQRLHGLQSDGRVDRATWNVLAQLYNHPITTPTSQER